ncbi:hypothetical protein EYR36_000209 [Pleurotus pulmonarius]|nr:hypothetical protein EYR36_000209 [Pleurotus pulmonarius]
MFGLTSILTVAGSGGSSYLVDTIRLFLLGTLVETGRRFCSWFIERFKFRYSMTARFSEGDPAYEWIILFLTEKNVWRRSRDFWVNSKTSARKWGITLGGEPEVPIVMDQDSEESTDYVPIYEIPQLFYWNGYWLEIHREQGPVQYHNRSTSQSAATLYLTIYSLDMSVMKALVDEARLRYVEVSKPNVIIHSSDVRNAGPSFTWNKVKSKTRRPLSSIILPRGELDSIIEDAQDFIDSEDWYMEAGIPHRRGYLLYGPPGTGKSSTIYALAGELGLEIYTISLSSDYIDDSTLQAAASSMPKRSILLIEDIDCAFASREDEEDTLFAPPSPFMHPNGVVPRRSAVTLSGLLNIIDGVDSEEGKFFIATTNYVDRLDAALIRPGRIDRKIEYRLATQEQAQALFTRFFPTSRFAHMASEKHIDLASLAEQFSSGIPEDTFSIAELQGFLLSCKKCPLDAATGVQLWVIKELEQRREREEREETRKLKLKAAKEKRDVSGGLGMGPFVNGSPYSPFGPFRNSIVPPILQVDGLNNPVPQTQTLEEPAEEGRGIVTQVKAVTLTSALIGEADGPQEAATEVD